MSLTNYHIKFGKHSNIPDCCIHFFLTTWQQWTYKDELNSGYREAMHAFGHNAGYIICPNCLLVGNIKKIHRCYDGCGFDYEKEKIKMRGKHG